MNIFIAKSFGAPGWYVLGRKINTKRYRNVKLYFLRCCSFFFFFLFLFFKKINSLYKYPQRLKHRHSLIDLVEKKNGVDIAGSPIFK